MSAAGVTAPESWDSWCDSHETHSGAVVMLGDFAYKFKKPVALGFLDFSGRATRRAVCEREVELNRRLAADVYLGVGDLARPGGPTEPVIVMRRLPDRLRLSQLVRSGCLSEDDVRRVARLVATFHAGARTDADVSRQGTRDALRGRWEANLAQATSLNTPMMHPADLDEIVTLVRRFLDGRNGLFDDRIRRGAIVDGHGDLTPDDIFCMPDGPRLLDCLEFDDTLRFVDRLDDVAFLAMGLENLGADHAARVLLDAWAEYVGDPAPPALAHHYIAYRAFVRAKVGCLRGAQHQGTGAAAVTRYVDTALAHLRAGAVTLVLIGGPPASGKTTLSGAVADRLGMTVLSSDRVRKELAGIDPQSGAAADFGTGIYSPAATERTYAALLDRAGRLLRLGESVILDATWGAADVRQQAAALAQQVSADLVELRCDVDAATALRRLHDRESLSDADATVAARLRDVAAPWPSGHLVDTAHELEESVEQACGLIRPHPAPGAVLRRRPHLVPD